MSSVAEGLLDPIMSLMSQGGLTMVGRDTEGG